MISWAQSGLWHSDSKRCILLYFPLAVNVSQLLETRTALAAKPVHALPYDFQCRVYRKQAMILLRSL